jgi:predicted amidohydrolase
LHHKLQLLGPVLQNTLLAGAQEALHDIARASRGKDILLFVGLPFSHKGKLYNCCAAVCDGDILGLVPKTAIPNYGEFYEMRHFASAPKTNERVLVAGQDVPFGTRLLFANQNLPEMVVGVEICEDLWMVSPPSGPHCQNGATIIINPSASTQPSENRSTACSLSPGSPRAVSPRISMSTRAPENLRWTSYIRSQNHQRIRRDSGQYGEYNEDDLLLTEIDVKRWCTSGAGIQAFSRILTRCMKRSGSSKRLCRRRFRGVWRRSRLCPTTRRAAASAAKKSSAFSRPG